MGWSSSSSVCPYENYLYENIPNYPTGMQVYSPTVTQPLVYYAQLQPKKQKQKTDRQNRKANCFVKAFRWYTQEHNINVQQNVTEDASTIGGFATWLDKKYEEYLQNHQSGSNQVFEQKKDQPSRKDELNKHGFSVSCDTFVTKKPAITKKQQWIKFKSSRKKLQSETGSHHPRSSQSLEFILQPKELKMSNSKCCNINCSNKTSGTDDFKTYTAVKKGHSMSNAAVENINKTGEKKKQKLFFGSKETNDLKETNVTQVPDGYKQLKTLDVDCECVNEEIVTLRRRPEVKISRETQFSHNVKTGPTEDKIMSITQTSELFENKRSVAVNAAKMEPKVSQKDCQCVNINYLFLDGHTQNARENIAATCDRVCRHSSTLQTPTAPRQAVVEDKLETKTSTRQGNHVIISKCATITQTSDYAIHINNDPRAYPLFMKILCPDKL